jgi:hypothetical protein
VLDVVELTENVAGRTAGDARDRSETLQIGPMTQRALRGGESIHSRCRNSPAFRDAAFGNVGDKFAAGVTRLELLEVFRGFDDSMAEGLGLVADDRCKK